MSTSLPPISIGMESAGDLPQRRGEGRLNIDDFVYFGGQLRAMHHPT